MGLIFKITELDYSQFHKDDYLIHFHYVLESERNNPIVQSSVVSDYSNAKYDRIEYSKINHVGKRWIEKYTLALAKEMLGAVRAKFSSIPIPNSDITLDGADLRSEAASEKEILISELRENLEATSRKALLQCTTRRIRSDGVNS